MSGRNGLLFPGGMPPAQPQMTIATPFNDIQLVAMIAGQLGQQSEDPEKEAMLRVALAIEIVAEAVAQEGYLSSRIRAARQNKEQGD